MQQNRPSQVNASVVDSNLHALLQKIYQLVTVPAVHFSARGISLRRARARLVLFPCTFSCDITGYEFGAVEECTDTNGPATFRQEVYERALDREFCATAHGVELGALHLPAPLPTYCQEARKFVDNWPRETLQKFYPEVPLESVRFATAYVALARSCA